MSFHFHDEDEQEQHSDENSFLTGRRLRMKDTFEQRRIGICYTHSVLF